MRGWLADSGFWTTADSYVRFWAQEVYGDIRAWGVCRCPADDPARQHLIEYVMHPLGLARAGGERTAAAEAFFRQCLPPARERRLEVALRVRVHGRRPPADAPLPVGAGVRDPARRRDAPARQATKRATRLRLGAGELSERAGLPDEESAGLQQRLASRCSRTPQGGSSQMGALRPRLGEHFWCVGAYDGAAFNDGWSAFWSWSSTSNGPATCASAPNVRPASCEWTIQTSVGSDRGVGRRCSAGRSRSRRPCRRLADVDRRQERRRRRAGVLLTFRSAPTTSNHRRSSERGRSCHPTERTGSSSPPTRRTRCA